MAINVHIKKKSMRSQISELMILKSLEKQETDKPKCSRRQEIKIIRADINETETERTSYRINQRISLKRLTRLSNCLTKLTKRKAEKTQINKIRDKKEVSTTNYNAIQKLVREYFESLHSKKL